MIAWQKLVSSQGSRPPPSDRGQLKYNRCKGSFPVHVRWGARTCGESGRWKLDDGRGGRDEGAVENAGDDDV